MTLPLRVLVIEDSPDDAELMAIELRRVGYEPHLSVVEGGERLRAALREPWDLVLADYDVPGFGGRAALGLVRELAHDVPFILVSGTADDEDAIAVMHAGANDYLSKDRLARLGPAVERELRDVETRRARRRAEASLRFLADASVTLAEPIDYETTLARIASLAVPFLADACILDLWEDGHLVRVGTAHVDPARAETMRANPADSPLTDLSARTGAPLLVPDVDGPERLPQIGPALHARFVELGVSSAMSVPLAIHGETVGAIAFGASARRYDHADLELAEDLAQRCALALHKARLLRMATDAVRKRDEFLAIAAHELRTPLTPLSLQIESIDRLLHAEPASPLVERLRPRLDVAARQMSRLGKLVESLLDVSRVMRDQLELQAVNLDLVALVREVAERVGPDASRAGSAITVDAPPRVVGTWDGPRLEQVVSNLLSNAVRYGRGQPIEVRVEDAGERARVRVLDHGIGISPADRARIFQRFERAVSGRHFGGLGIGLWIARRIVEAHGGTIDVESQPDQGSVFTVSLPKARQPAAAAGVDGVHAPHT